MAPTLRGLMPDPSTLADMDRAARRLAEAVALRQRIAVFGDYDVDGAASTALLVDWLRALGREATFYIPDRIDEGYGPNVPAMAELGRDARPRASASTAARWRLAPSPPRGRRARTSSSSTTICRAPSCRTPSSSTRTAPRTARASAISAPLASSSCCWSRRTG